jgi:C-terminal, D2-small domain, of ClpB protein
VEERIGDRGMRLQLLDSAVDYLASCGFDPVFGARPVKRAVQRELESGLAKVGVRTCLPMKSILGVGALTRTLAFPTPTNRNAREGFGMARPPGMHLDSAEAWHVQMNRNVGGRTDRWVKCMPAFLVPRPPAVHKPDGTFLFNHL